MALSANPLVVEVSKGTTHAAPPTGAASNGERVIFAHGEAASVDCASLRRAVKLELAVSHNGACAAKLVVQDAVLEGAVELAVRSLCRAVVLVYYTVVWNIKAAKPRLSTDACIPVGRSRAS